jgi:4'-phosphopantetheinyl transferase
MMEARPVVEGLDLVEDEAHVWWIPLRADARALELHRQVLSPDELDRAGRFYFDQHRNQYVIGRGAMRRILSRYVNVQPQDLEFVYGPKGKPDFTPHQNPHHMRFNLSHSGGLALLGVSKNQELGVDVEFVKADFGGMEIAERFFSAKEVQTLFAIAAAERNAAFFACWTRKEAFIKAIGEGLSVPLDSFDVAFAPNARPALTRVEGNPDEVSRWNVYDIPASAEYKAAMVIEGQGHRLVYHHWPQSSGDLKTTDDPMSR